MTWNKPNHAHEVQTTEGLNKEPEFPEQPFEALIKLAFDGAAITTPDHRIIKHLQGEVT